MAGLTADLAHYASTLAFDAIPPETVAIAKNGILDTSGVMIAGRNEDAPDRTRQLVETDHGNPAARSSVFLGPRRLPAPDAALVNGVAAHVLDYDDVGLRAHPSVVLVPALLAEGEQRGASGADVIRGYIAGYEVWADLNAREPGAQHVKGWHPTSAVGVVGAAAAVAALAGLDAERTRNALALAASMSGGVVANFGTMTKSFQVGRAAAAGIQAVRLAEIGMTGAADALEHPAGLLAALSPEGKADRSSPARVTEAFRILENGLSFKRYPVCYCAHRIIDGAIGLAQTHDIDPRGVRRITARIGTTQRVMLRYDRPWTVLEAKFSAQFGIAAALVSRTVGLNELRLDYVRRPDVQAVCEAVAIELDSTTCPVEPAFSLTDRVVIEMTDGRVLDSGEIRFARGHARHPIGPEELRAKFLDCTAGSDVNGARLYDLLARLEEVADIRSLAAGHPAGAISP